MSKQLYEEALADVKKLKEIAEDNAKKALIEAVSPRIKDLIEAELLREADDKQDSDDLLMDEEPAVMEPVSVEPMAMEPVVDPGVAAAMSVPDEEGKVTLDLDALNVTPAGEEYELSNESLSIINPLVQKLNSATVLQVESKLFQLGESVQSFLIASNSVKRTTGYQRKVLEMVSEIEDVYEYLQESTGNLRNKEVYEGKLEDLYKKLNKLVEQYNMKKNLRSLTEAEITLKLTNVPDDLKDKLGDLGVDLVADEGGEDEESSDEEGGDEDLDLGGDEGDEGSEDEGGEDESEESGDEDLDLGGDEESDEETAEEAQQMETRRLRDNLVVEIDENMLRREIARMRSLREADETKPQSWGHGPGDVSSEEDFEADDLGDPFVDIDLSEADEPKQGMHQYDEDDDEMSELEELEQVMQAKDAQAVGGERDEAQSQKQNRMPEADDKHEVDDDKQESDDDKHEGDEEKHQVQEARRRLAREARIQTEAKKKAQAAKKQQKEAQKKAQAKQVESQQQAKKGQKSKSAQAKQEAAKQAKQAKKMQEAYAYYANIFNESVRRTAKLQSVLAENRRGVNQNGTSTRSTAETSNLRKKLAETNLFNTKLLYCNKLLQNESLTKRQKAEIIERLDEAKSEREVKLVYESLTKALGTTTRRMTESVARPVLGSSSQATRPASTVLSEGYEADRWAKLAGLK